MRGFMATKAARGLPHVNPYSAVAAAYSLVSANQGLNPAVQLAASAILFKVLADSTGVSAGELLNKTARMLDDLSNTKHFTPSAELEALKAYAKGEL